MSRVCLDLAALRKQHDWCLVKCGKYMNHIFWICWLVLSKVWEVHELHCVNIVDWCWLCGVNGYTGFGWMGGIRHQMLLMKHPMSCGTIFCLWISIASLIPQVYQFFTRAMRDTFCLFYCVFSCCRVFHNCWLVPFSCATIGFVFFKPSREVLASLTNVHLHVPQEHEMQLTPALRPFHTKPLNLG